MPAIIEPFCIEGKYRTYSIISFQGRCYYINSSGRCTRMTQKCIKIRKEWINSGNYSGDYSGNSWKNAILEHLAQQILGRPFRHAFFTDFTRRTIDMTYDDENTISSAQWAREWTNTCDRITSQPCHPGDVIHCKVLRSGEQTDEYYIVPPEGITPNLVLQTDDSLKGNKPVGSTSHAKNLALGNAIRAMRKERNITQAELAERIHFSVEYLGRIENGHVAINRLAIHNIASALGVDPEELIVYYN